MLAWQRRRLWRTLLALVAFIACLLYAWSIRPTRTPPTFRPTGSPVAPAASTAPWEVTVIEDTTCLPAQLSDIEQARTSIDIAMYVIRPDAAGPVRALLEAVSAASRRGVRVRVLLDRSEHGSDRHDLFNRAAAAILKEARADVRFDQPGIELHEKLVIVDGRIAYVGAHNWTPDALAQNHEISLRLESREPIAEATADFVESWAQGSDPGRVSAELPTGDDVVIEEAP